MINKVRNLYNSGYSLAEIGEIFNLKKDQVCSIMVHNNIPRRSQGNRTSIKFSQQTQVRDDRANKIIELYNNGEFSKSIADYIGMSESAVLYWLDKSDIDTSLRERPRKYIVNENYFDKIDTEDKAYWLGFITADGHIVNQRSQKRLVIELQADDIGHLEKFKNSIGFTGDISTRTRKKIYPGFISEYYRSAIIVICSKKLVEKLEVLGIRGNKSCDVKPCEFIPKNLLRHYYRGLVDGDGYISKETIGLTGNIYMVTAFMNFIKNSGIDTKAKCCRRGKVACVFKISGASLFRKTKDLLYGESTTYLDRKYNLLKFGINEGVII